MSKQPTKTEAIKNFLTVATHPDLAALYHYGMEVQVNVAQDGGDRISSEGFRGRTWHSYSNGIQQWKSFRIPWKASSAPEYNDSEIKYDLAEHVEGIGLTGWNWEKRESIYVGFDFDAISGHSVQHTSKLSDLELEAVKSAACELPWVTVRRSTSGNGLHLYVFVDNIHTKTHTEHAALGRAILGKMASVTGFDFESKVDAAGGNFWVWHRKMSKANRGLELIKQGCILEDIPVNWKDHVDVIRGKRKKNQPRYIDDNDITTFEEMTGQRPRIKLDDQHKKLLAYLDKQKAQHWWDQDHYMLVAHTHDLKMAHKELGLRGIFSTIATGSDQGADHNVFCYPLERPSGSWVLRRYTQGVEETPNWDQDGSGWTMCYYNRDSTLDVAARSHEGTEDEKGGFQFATARQAVVAAKSLGALLNLPEWALGRPTQLKGHKDGRLVVYVKQEPTDSPNDMRGWHVDKGYWKRIFNARLQQPGESEILSYDNVVRHLVTVAGTDFGWVLRAGSEWRIEPYTNIRLALKALSINNRDLDIILGKCVFEGWTLTTEPFQEEFPGGRKWNRNAPQLRFHPQEEEPYKHPTWDRILAHCGKGLDMAITGNGWCRANNIQNGADYLRIWVASLFQFPKRPLPYLFFYSKEERTGKTTFHDSIGMLMTCGYIRADLSIISGAGFNGELENAILCAVEETNLQKSIHARNRIKDWVTSRTMLIHHKGRTPYQVENSVHFVQTGNDFNECPIFPGDTRITMIHVPPFDLSEMLMPDQLKAQLEQEAPAFLGSLLNIEIPSSLDRLNVPVIDSDIKIQTGQSNRTSLEVFLDDVTFDAPGEKVLYATLYAKFTEWLDAGEVHEWSKIKFGRELISTYPKGRMLEDGAKFYVGNISFTEPDPNAPVKSKYFTHDNKLVREAE